MITKGDPVDIAPVGILMLDTNFERINGDIGNPRTFSFPVRYKIVREAQTANIVASPETARLFLPQFIAAAEELESEGVSALTTSCGFLSIFQKEIASAVNIPVLTSSLFLGNMVHQMVGKKPVGIVTAHSGQLSDEHLLAAGLNREDGFLVRGLEHAPAFSSFILNNSNIGKNKLCIEALSQEVTDLCIGLQNEVPDLGAIIFECTNLQPYAGSVQLATRLPVFGIYHVVELLQKAASAPKFETSF